MPSKLIIFAGIIGVTILFPRCSHFEAYQRMLWTDKSPDPDAEQILDSWLLNNGVRVEGLVSWHRLRLGFPTAPVTIDRDEDGMAMQCRVEYICVVFNLVLVSFCTGLIFLVRWRLKKDTVKRHLHPDEY